MSYYVTLPSNGSDLTSDYGKLHNTQSDFEIDLKKPLKFPHKTYEVGLAQFSYRKSWIVNIGKFTVNDTALNIKLLEKKLFLMDGISMNQVVDILNEKLNDFKKEKQILNTQYSKIVFSLNKSFKLEIFVPFGLSVTIEGFFVSLIRYRPSTTQNFGDTWIEFEKDRLDYVQNNISFINPNSIIINGHPEHSIKCYIASQHLNYVQNIYIYTNIIDEVHVGSDMVKLLRIVPVASGNLDNNVMRIFHFPHYLSLAHNMIERIRMFCCDSEGNKIKFTDEHANVMYKLHFKPKS